jgi:predicted enzyme related to lactoylglutathione lyase
LFALAHGGSVPLCDDLRADVAMTPAPSLIEFPADDTERARRFWSELLGVELGVREEGEGEGWQTRGGGTAVGVHERGRGPGDSFSLPYFAVADIGQALERVTELGGSVVHPGESWAICRDSEGSPFGLAREALGG